MNKKLKIKDVLLIALLTAVYMIIYMATMVIITPLGALGHAISPGICSLFSGIVIYFMSRKIGKMWQYSLMTLLVMANFALMGGGYIPWLISSVSMAVIADFIASKSRDVSVFKVATASGIMHVGQAWGAIIPSIFFVESYKETWIKRGQTLESMNEQIKYTAGIWGIISTVLVFVLAFIGVYIGYLILRKHFKEN
ncbi:MULTISPECIES: MptD family putative ECF transporter S component [Peptoniphilus]|uniref:MptD family putative ECF transporter S component n=1 Tax=Peptoniphilus TaxID=162289 RepID=UPI0001DA9A7E|nr:MULTISPECIES: MptD family putative ECF transporter S component [Peptoniphilus]EFI41944.1 conserved hypothetical protein TIGR02185 [Peptoniphilus sp. oral taxon 386 str. F0131]